MCASFRLSSLPVLPRCRCPHRNAERTCASNLLYLWPRLLYDLMRERGVMVLRVCKDVSARLQKWNPGPHLSARPGSLWWVHRACTCTHGHDRRLSGGPSGWWRPRCLLHKLPVTKPERQAVQLYSPATVQVKWILFIYYVFNVNHMTQEYKFLITLLETKLIFFIFLMF